MKNKKNFVRIDGEQFKDSSGRTLFLRGLNVTSKVPATSNFGTFAESHYDPKRGISYVNRPFPLEEAKEHFRRIHFWGFNLIRLVITWDAIEHQGPGKYDKAYLDYLYELVKIAGEEGLSLFVDFHQDCWGRAFSGSGAPNWTAELVGMDLHKLEKTHAALLHKQERHFHRIWPTNYWRYATATMFTLFFGGPTFAPSTKIRGENIGDYLQRHFIGSMLEVVKRLKKFSHVIGYEIFNEPSEGYLGCKNLGEKMGLYHLRSAATPFQGMLMASGHSERIEVWKKSLFRLKRAYSITGNKEREILWKVGFECPWKKEGVWGYDAIGRPQLLQPGYFARKGRKKVDFSNDFFRPFVEKAAQAIHSISPDACIFVENVIGEKPAKFRSHQIHNLVFSAHWYDGFVLFLKRYFSFIAVDVFDKKVIFNFPKKIREALTRQVGVLRKMGLKAFGKRPMMITEFGISFDLNEKKSYITGNFSAQAKALDRSIHAMESNLMSWCLWNYTSHNDNLRGDLWNGEDLSIFSKRQMHPSDGNYSGLRAKEAIIRPATLAVAGLATRMRFDLAKKTYELEYLADQEVVEPTMIYLPIDYIKGGYQVEISDGSYTVDSSAQRLFHFPSKNQSSYRIKISPQ